MLRSKAKTKLKEAGSLPKKVFFLPQSTKTAPCRRRFKTYHWLLLVWLSGALLLTPRTARLKEFSLAVKIRMARHGAKKRPYYRVVVADGRMPRDGRYIEQVGRYNPLTNPKTIELDLEKIDEWIAKGAQPSNTVAKLIDIVRTGAPAPEKKKRVSKKQAAKAASSEE
jgi:small subunit ribosomal protein S16